MRNAIIVALDVPSVEKARSLVSQLAPLVGGFMVEALGKDGLNWLFMLALTFILAGCGMQVMGIRRRNREIAPQVAYS